MKKVTIYEDDTQKITMPLKCANYLTALLNLQFRLDIAAAEEILDISLSMLEERDKSLQKMKVISSTKVPIVNRGQFFETAMGYEDLMPAIIMLIDFFSQTIDEMTDEEKDEISFMIEQFYQDNYNQNCFLFFFSEKIYNVDATLILIDDKKLLVLPLSFNETDEFKTWY